MDILLKNAKLLTQNEKREILTADILIEGNTIKRIGKVTEKAEIVLDCKNKLVTPGLINTHTHLAMTLLRGYADDMELNQWLTTKIWPIEAKITGNDIYHGTLLGAIELIKSGTTCFVDMYFNTGKVAEAVDKIGIRANLSYGMIDLGKKEKREKELKETEAFIKKYNNTSDGRVTCSIGPHAIYTCSEDLLLKTTELSKKYNANIQIHLSETRKEVFDCLKEKGKRPVDYLNSIGFLSSKVIASHCVWLTKQEVKTLAKNNVKVAHDPVSNMKLASGGVTPVKEMLENNVVVSLGTDGASSNNSLNLLETMKVTCL
ncbi:amidohydrolase, partial [Candidatus Micrarchaeota archaeon]|nr:amidohydrolase [Candidatus Micrarchaeota archaeon]